MISQEIAYTAQMFMQVHENSSDPFYKDVVKISKALLQCYHDQQAKDTSAEIVEQLKQINKQLMIIGNVIGVPRAGINANMVNKKPNPNILKSIALDGTVREAEAP